MVNPLELQLGEVQVDYSKHRAAAYDLGMAAASKSKRTGVLLAVFVGGPALAFWAVWAFVIATIVYSAVVATNTVAHQGETGQYISVCTTPDTAGDNVCITEG